MRALEMITPNGAWSAMGRFEFVPLDVFPSPYHTDLTNRALRHSASRTADQLRQANTRIDLPEGIRKPLCMSSDASNQRQRTDWYPRPMGNVL